MTKPQFEIYSPLPGSKNAPLITAEQMSNFLYYHIGSGPSKQIAEILNATDTPDFYGALQVTYVPPVVSVYGFDVGATVYSTNAGWGFTTGFGPYIVKRQAGNYVGMECGSAFPPDYLTTDETLSAGYVPPKPKFLSIERPVRGPDIEAGDILLFCGAPGQDYFIDNGYLTVGKEYVVGPNNSIDYDVVTKQGIVRGYWGNTGILTGWSFVRRPGFAKVRDGYVKNGDTVYWLGSYGPEKGVVGDEAWENSNRHNIEDSPWCYQKAEPSVIVEFGLEPKARYAYLESDYATVRDNEGGAL